MHRYNTEMLKNCPKSPRCPKSPQLTVLQSNLTLGRHIKCGLGLDLIRPSSLGLEPDGLGYGLPSPALGSRSAGLEYKIAC